MGTRPLISALLQIAELSMLVPSMHAQTSGHEHWAPACCGVGGGGVPCWEHMTAQWLHPCKEGSACPPCHACQRFAITVLTITRPDNQSSLNASNIRTPLWIRPQVHLLQISTSHSGPGCGSTGIQRAFLNHRFSIQKISISLGAKFVAGRPQRTSNMPTEGTSGLIQDVLQDLIIYRFNYLKNSVSTSSTLD